MPIYEYECIPNKHRFEVIQKFSDLPVTHCTVCGEPVQRLLSSPAIQFKGSGWYITDYARKSNPPADGSKDKDKDKDTAAAASKDAAPPTDTSKKSTTDGTSTSKSESKD